MYDEFQEPVILKELRKRILKYNKQITKIINNKKAKEEGVQLKWEI